MGIDWRSNVNIVEGLKQMRKRAIAHRDLKPQNIFLTNAETAPYCKIGDFGEAKLMSELPSFDRVASVVGTPEYMVRELFCQAAPT